MHLCRHVNMRMCVRIHLFLRVYMCKSLYMYLCKCIHVSLYLYSHMSISLHCYAHTYIHISIYIHTCVCAFAYPSIYVYTYIYMYTHVYLSIYPSIYLYMYIHACNLYVHPSLHVCERTHSTAGGKLQEKLERHVSKLRAQFEKDLGKELDRQWLLVCSKALSLIDRKGRMFG